MTPAAMRELLRECHRDKHVLRHQHASAARYVSSYEFNNTYQYIIAREDVHLRWLIDAVSGLGGEVDESAVPDVDEPARRTDPLQAILSTDRDAARRFVEKWQPRVDTLPNARHQTMLRIILGETLEHQRFFDLALAGRADLLGRRADGAGTGGGVLSERWVGGG